MSRLDERLEKSRLADVVAKMEKGEAVDVPHVLALQALDMARDGQLALADALEREREADEQFRIFGDGE